jgi:hypothetical protein
MKPRRLIVVYPAGDPVRIHDSQKRDHGPSMAHDQINLTGIPNANTQCPLMIYLQEMCELGDWHTMDKIMLPPYGND